MLQKILTYIVDEDDALIIYEPGGETSKVILNGDDFKEYINSVINEDE